MARKKKVCDFCADTWFTDYKEHRNGYCLWAEIYPYNANISVIAQANDENGEMIEDSITLPFNYCPNCGRRLEIL